MIVVWSFRPHFLRIVIVAVSSDRQPAVAQLDFEGYFSPKPPDNGREGGLSPRQQPNIMSSLVRNINKMWLLDLANYPIPWIPNIGNRDTSTKGN